MLRNQNFSATQNNSYSDFDRLLDEIIRTEDDFTSEIRFFTQRLADMEARMHKSIAELMQMINENGVNYTAM